MKDILKMLLALWLMCGLINVGGMSWYFKHNPPSPLLEGTEGAVMLSIVAFTFGPIWLGSTLQQAID